ncbi:alpha-farnesene synthase-like [Impatiens glandulifera]|uniref:alpha-farnesene synthase-like n=1 Tax=Impatiens glandulifera TaxID=253017 RepID=UPI001FB14577|nr:alpha-farnesene synthase-like [Impatiens glandulifera]
MNIENLKDIIKDMFLVTDWITKLKLVNQIDMLCLNNHFETEIKETIDVVMLMYHNDGNVHEIRHDALSLRILRQYGFKVSQDVFRGFVNRGCDNNIDVQELIAIFEASHLGSESESLLDNAKILSTKLLENKFSNIKQTREALQLPLNRRVLWYDLKRRISDFKNSDEDNIVLLNLAKLNFNNVQANHHQELGILIRWWKKLGLMEHLSFTRDRVVESYLWSVGVNYEPQHKSFRKWLTKAITMVIVIDDVYDLFGSFKELECFTNAIIRWDLHEVDLLPNCMKVCLEALFSLTEETALEIQTEKGGILVLPHLKNAVHLFLILYNSFFLVLFIDSFNIVTLIMFIVGGLLQSIIYGSKVVQ